MIADFATIKPKIFDLGLVPKLASSGRKYASDVSALRDAAKDLTEDVVAKTKFVDKPEPLKADGLPFAVHTALPFAVHTADDELPSSETGISREATPALSPESIPWSINVTTDNLFHPNTVTLHFPQFPTELDLFDAIERVLGHQSTIWQEPSVRGLIFTVIDGPLKGCYDSFDTIRVS